MPEKSQINLTCQYKVQNESFTIVFLTPCKMTTSRDQGERRVIYVKMYLFLVLNIVTYNEYDLGRV